MLRIGSLNLSSPVFLAPMSGITDLPFRLISRSFGCEFAFTEMISAKALIQESGRTERMLSTLPEDSPLGVQLLGNDADVLRKAVDRLMTHRVEVIDLNAACPVAKVTAKGEGASLMRDPGKLRSLLKALVNHAAVPVTVKIRAGWDEGSINAREAALEARDAGIHGLIIHGRTRVQRYSGRADYRIIREVKEALDIPVMGSGDIFSPQAVKRMLEETGCDGVAIARGALGNPWIFRETAVFLEKGVAPARPGIDEIADTMTRHLALFLDFYGRRRGPVLFRKFLVWYTGGIAHAKSLRERAFSAKTEDEMIAVIETFRVTCEQVMISNPSLP